MLGYTTLEYSLLTSINNHALRSRAFAHVQTCAALPFVRIFVFNSEDTCWLWSLMLSHLNNHCCSKNTRDVCNLCVKTTTFQTVAMIFVFLVLIKLNTKSELIERNDLDMAIEGKWIVIRYGQYNSNTKTNCAPFHRLAFTYSLIFVEKKRARNQDQFQNSLILKINLSKESWVFFFQGKH